jgi:hypothetical protein
MRRKILSSTGKAIIIFYCLLHLSETLEAQFNSDQSDPTVIATPTPQAASLGKFGQVPVDLNNGLFDLSIPIYRLPVKGHNIDIKLSYHSGGIKPTEKGGTVGVGWSLMATGTITRIQNGLLDEFATSSYSDSGYYWNRSQLNKTNWDYADTIKNFLRNIVCVGISDGDCAGHTQWNDWAPDEFQFNFFGYSGSFWLDHTGTWIIRENSGEKLKIVVDFGYYAYKYATATDSVRLSNTFRKFTITDGNGNIFVFGGNSNSIEFNRNDYLNNPVNAQATSWYLTQIITSKGEKIDFSYQRLAPSATVYGSMNCYKAVLGTNTYSKYDLETLSGVPHDPIYLQQISYRNLLIQFSYSQQNIKYYPTNSLSYDSRTGVAGTDVYNIIHSQQAKYPSIEIDGTAANPKDYELDSLRISYGAYTRRFTFEYYTTGSNRLFLKYLKEGPITRQLVHQFDYNGTWFSDTCIQDPYRKLAEGILTTKVDHWGYYTGKLPFQIDNLPTSGGIYQIRGSGSPYYYPSDNFISYYYNNRQPIFDSLKIGSLSKVTYPTGGYTEFIYEAHDYSSQIDFNDNIAKFFGNNLTAGGLRIKEIRSYSGGNAPLVIKKYKYVSDNGYSSGVLNSSGILYKDSLIATTNPGGQTFIYKYLFDNNQFPLQNTNGNHITYSRVDEINADNGKTIYRYTNHDNGHHDLQPTVFISATANAVYYRALNSRNFHRGKLFKQEIYDSLSNLLSKDTTSYIDDDYQTSNYVGVRAYNMKGKDIKMMNFIKNQGSLLSSVFKDAHIWVPNISPYVFYVHDYPMVQKTTTTYSGSNTLSTTETFAYNATNNKISKDSIKNLSDGSTKIDSYNYPNDFSSGNSFYTGMVTDNVINPVIQKTTTNQSNKVLSVLKDSLTKTTLPLTNLYLLNERKIYQVSTDVTKMTVLKYDSVGNPLWALGADGIPVCYQWDYSFQYPTVVVKNANDSDYAYTSFEAEAAGNWGYGMNAVTINQGSTTGKKAYDLVGGMWNNNLDPSKKYILSFWAKSGTPGVNINYQGGGSNIILYDGMPPKKTIGDWSYFELSVENAIGVGIWKWGHIAYTYVDEVRLYPNTALMTSYTYDPLIGMTSQCDANNRINYYEYDVFGKLVLIRDQDKNVIKTIDYKVLGQ